MGGFYIRPFVSGAYGMLPYEALKIKDYLLASSTATATATVIPGLGVVTCADESHHLCALVSFEMH